MNNFNNKNLETNSDNIFCYDIVNNNPNGDPLNENMPRMDNKRNLVSCHRLKRTIRDYLSDYMGENIFLMPERKENDYLKTKEEVTKDRIKEIKKNKTEEDIKDISEKDLLLSNYKDLITFGAVMATKSKSKSKECKGEECKGEEGKGEECKGEDKGKPDKKINKKTSWNLTGALQFDAFGKSMHNVKPEFSQGTSVFPSQSNKNQGTFTDKKFVPYSLIQFTGRFSGLVIKKNELKYTKEDLLKNFKAMWLGTQALSTTSKYGHEPRFLISINYADTKTRISDLNTLIKFVNKNDKKEEDIRSISETGLDITHLIEKIKEKKEKIFSIDYEINELVTLICDGNEVKVKDFEQFLKDTINDSKKIVSRIIE